MPLVVTFSEYHTLYCRPWPTCLAGSCVVSSRDGALGRRVAAPLLLRGHCSVARLSSTNFHNIYTNNNNYTAASVVLRLTFPPSHDN